MSFQTENRIWIAVTALALYFIYVLISPLWTGESTLHLGLDLAGGVQVVYEPNFQSSIDMQNKLPRRELLAICKDVLISRLEGKLKTIPEVFVRSDDRIVVSIPNVQNYQQVMDLVGQTYRLTWRLVLAQSRQPIEGPGVYTSNGVFYKLAPATLTGDMLDERRIVVRNPNPASPAPNLRVPGVQFAFRPEYQDAVREFTRTNIRKFVAILLDDKVQLVSVILSELPGSGEITLYGRSLESARDIVLLLKSGTLPLSLEVKQVSKVGPSLGQQLQTKGITAALISFLLLIALLSVSYLNRFWFLLAAFASLISLAIFVAGFAATFNFTLDIGAIAGLILTLAMGVDAFVIVFESLERATHAFTDPELKRYASSIVTTVYSFRFLGFVLLHPSIAIVLVSLPLVFSERLRSFGLFMSLGVCASLLTIWFTRSLLLNTQEFAPYSLPDPMGWLRGVKPGIYRFWKLYLGTLALVLAGFGVYCWAKHISPFPAGMPGKS